MPVERIVTGTEEREINGPFKPPLWDGLPGTRSGQLAYDNAGVVDGSAGHIAWDGTAWGKIGGDTKEYADTSIFATGSPTGKFIRQGNRLHGIFNNLNQVTYSYDKVTTGPNGAAMSDAYVDGRFYVKYLPTGEYFKADVSGCLQADFFGLVGDAYYVNTATGILYSNAGLTVVATDDTTRMQAAINVAVWTGKDLLLEQKNYKITDSLTIPGLVISGAAKSFHIMGQGTGLNTYIRFQNATADKQLFTIGNGMSFPIFTGVSLRDESAISIGFKFVSSLTSPASVPLWKMSWEYMKIDNFKIGIWFYGDSNYLQDSLLDGCSFYKVGFRNCRTSVLYENTQAVNHNYYACDIENGIAADASTPFKMFHFKRGSVVNINGGSFIGAGPLVYIEELVGGHFQLTSQISFIGGRMEQRGSVTPIVWHAENSIITGSNYLKVNLHNFSIYSTYAGGSDSILAKLGGQIHLDCKNVCTNKLFYVYATMTLALAANGQVGSITVTDSFRIEYKRYLPAGTEYNSTTVLSSSLLQIPARIVNKAIAANTYVDGNGYVRYYSTDVQITPTSLNSTVLKVLTFEASTDTGILGSANPGNVKIGLPIGARPIKLGIEKTYADIAIPFTITLSIDVAGTSYPSAVIDTTSFAGYAETNILQPTGSVNKLLVDGTLWDGGCTITKSGNTAGFRGTIFIYYI